MTDTDARTKLAESPPSGGVAGDPARTTGYTAGQVVSEKYRLIRRLGEGGMAAVWVAHNEALDINVAIKFIRAELQNAGLTSRLLQEARAAARLGHPAIVRVSDFGKTEAGDPYIVMELLNGEDLAATLKRRGPIPALRAVRTLLPIADALAAAHAKKIVHRDLKPENIYLAQTEDARTQPKLVDFGIAKLEVEDSQRITQLGATMGSPAYMSPEQARGFDVDPRTDVWAFCVVLYEVLTGQLPFTGTTYTALVCSILESQPKSIVELGVGDPELWGIIAHGLEKDPARRAQSMREVGAGLARWAIARGAADDLTGSSLISTWIERPPDSARQPLQSSAFGATVTTPVPQTSSPSGASIGSTQLNATLSGGAKPRARSTLLLVLAAGAVVLVLGIAIGIRAVSGGAKAEASGAPPERALGTARELRPEMRVEPTTTAERPVAPATPSVTPAVSATAPPAPTPTRKANVPGAPKVTKPTPSAKPVAKPPTKPPELDIKTNL